MNERSERIIGTGFGEAFYAEPFIGGPCPARTRDARRIDGAHR